MTGHHGFHSRWREPKIFVVYTLDGKGRCRRDHPPIHDATLGNADAVFALLKEYLVRAGIIEASEIIFVADGAPWIWERVDKLIEDLRIDPRKVTEVVDFYHACEHISAALDQLPGICERRRQSVTRTYAASLPKARPRHFWTTSERSCLQR